MFQNLKSKNSRKGKWSDRPNAGAYPSKGFHVSSGATTYSIYGDEKKRMVNCKICGFPCDRTRDTKAKLGSWAGIGVSQGQQLTAGTSIGDRRVPSAGSVSTAPDYYYERTVTGGCPCCGSLVYDGG